MSAVFKKLNLKDHENILVLNAPASFETELASLENVVIHRMLDEVAKIDFSLAFVTTQAELDRLSRTVGEKAEGDAILWFAYPKGSSKKYKCEFNRDSGWTVLGELGFEPVRQVAIDEDWSALRFRRAAYIKTMARDKKMTISEEGKQRTQSKS